MRGCTDSGGKKAKRAQPHRRRSDATDTSHLANDAAAAEDPPLQTVVHERIKGVIIRRLTKVHTATRAELKQSLESKHRPSFDEVFDALVADDNLVVADEGAKTTRWCLASPEQKD